ncbi:solute carrier family 35 (UDP-galactose transporter), member B1 [Cryptococcus neoformans C23]|nr:solute carrier family 35 (UDP-galactose transporter), member B1 [Cryptococcus neoformans var. grubii AD2-60a]OWZ45166.1 solute carrier family 35 (UDP-galactose transporter), member B1 [Cryptococcus neoformans var. grubii C23]OWZ45855.1 solute carrier family 35 (UDP-galactose transporter), member B1 [Cryptococcus neoformans var. grubii AD1-83a]OWZ54868.1 solute carrier family 35 (UDP-galactose transporter), member B1 [Cryptococcus neoformans var. grubii 125.91]OXC85345.1 solute carrier family
MDQQPPDLGPMGLQVIWQMIRAKLFGEKEAPCKVAGAQQVLIVFPHSPSDPPLLDKFPSPLFLNFAQAVASSLSALCYLSFKSWREGWKGRGLGQVLGLKEVFGKSRTALNGDAKANEEVSELNEKTKEVARKAPKPPLSHTPQWFWARTIEANILRASISQSLSLSLVRKLTGPNRPPTLLSTHLGYHQLLLHQ